MGLVTAPLALSGAQGALASAAALVAVRVSYAIAVPLGVVLVAVNDSPLTRGSPASRGREVNVPGGLCVLRTMDSIETPGASGLKSLACARIAAVIGIRWVATGAPSTKYSKPVAVQSIR